MSARVSGEARPDFDEEARKLWRRLNLPESGPELGSRFNEADVVWAHPKTRALFFIGDISIASSRESLREKRITNIVNCQEEGSENFFEKDPALSYYRLPITHWQDAPNGRSAMGLLCYLAPFFGWVDERLARGENVMVHCLAGAHRAGTAGTAYVMYKTGLGAKDAVKHVQACREIVEPIYDFADLLRILERSLLELKEKLRSGQPAT